MRDAADDAEERLRRAAASVPPGPWAVGVSGGADSVALLSLLRARHAPAPAGVEPHGPLRDLSPHVVHLDHQTRGDASAGDADFVRELAARWGLPCTVARREELERESGELPRNPSARYRALRLELFRRVVASRGLRGVLLAHHADDQAETVLHRLLRGSGFAGLGGMSEVSCQPNLTIRRPLLGLRRDELRRHLLARGQPWREDASNESADYFRNHLRRVLSRHPHLFDELISLAAACRAARGWVHAHAPTLDSTFPAERLRRLPPPLAHESARRWLLARGAPPAALGAAPGAVDRLLAMAADAGSPARRHFPGGLLVRRRGGVIGVE